MRTKKKRKGLLPYGVYELPVTTVRLRNAVSYRDTYRMKQFPDTGSRRSSVFDHTQLDIKHDSYLAPSFWLYSHMPTGGGISYSADILLGKHLLVKYLSSFHDMPMLNGLQVDRFADDRTPLMWARSLMTSVIHQQIQSVAIHITERDVESLIDIDDLYVRDPDPDNDMVLKVFGTDNYVVQHFEYCIRIDPQKLDFLMDRSTGDKADNHIILFPIGDIFCEDIHGDEVWTATCPIWSPGHSAPKDKDRASEIYALNSYDPTHLMFTAQSYQDISIQVVDSWLLYIERLLAYYLYVNPQSQLGRTLERVAGGAYYDTTTGEVSTFPDIEYSSYQLTLQSGIEPWQNPS